MGLVKLQPGDRLLELVPILRAKCLPLTLDKVRCRLSGEAAQALSCGNWDAERS